MWHTTSPPIRACLKMYIDCSSSGAPRPMSAAIAASAGVRLKASNTGSRSCIAWPELVEGEVGVGLEAPAGVEGAALEESADRLAARQEILLGGMERAAVRGEHGRLPGRRDVLARERDGAFAKREAALRRHESGQHEKPVAPVLRELRGRQRARSRGGAALQAGFGREEGGLVGLLPGELRQLAAEMAVGGGLA